MKDKIKTFFEKHKIKIFVALIILDFILCCVSGFLKIKLDNATYQETLHDCYICGKSMEISQINESYRIECDSFKGGCGLTTGFYSSKVKLAKDWNNIANCQ